jgi:large subunit ribosomal protein L21
LSAENRFRVATPFRGMRRFFQTLITKIYEFYGDSLKIFCKSVFFFHFFPLSTWERYFTLSPLSHVMNMFAVVTIAGFQETVREGETLKVPRLDAEENKKVVFNDVLMLSKSDDDITWGKPLVDGASVEATVVSHGRDKKIRVYKMKHRKRYQRTQGHRQQHSVIKIEKINAK